MARREKVLSPDIAPEMALTCWRAPATRPTVSTRGSSRSCARCWTAGHREIGNILNISPKTVQNVHLPDQDQAGRAHRHRARPAGHEAR